MDSKELRQKTDKELAEMAQSIRESLRNFRFELAADAVKDVRSVREAKKTLARVLTIQTERLPAGRQAPKDKVTAPKAQ